MLKFKLDKGFYKVSGVYRIVSLKTGLCYVGGSVNIYGRIGNHSNNLRNGVHDSKQLQEEYNLYSKENFGLEILDRCDHEQIQEREQYWKDNFVEQLVNPGEVQEIVIVRESISLEKFKGRFINLYSRVLCGLKEDDCWQWIGKIRKQYPQVRTSRTDVAAHRLSYFLHTGEDPGPLVVRHTCDNRMCCNPKHLITGTQKENQHDRRDRFRSSKYTEDQIKEIRLRYQQGDRLVDLKKEFGSGVGMIVNNKAWHDPEYIYTPHKPGNKGKSGTGMSQELVDEIRRMADEGKTSREIAELFNLSDSYANNIVTGVCRPNREEPKLSRPKYTVELTEEDRLRFWSHVDKTGECWIWTSRLRKDAAILRKNRFDYFAHQVAYELIHGPISFEYEIRRNCGCKSCVNPEHMVLRLSKVPDQRTVKEIRRLYNETKVTITELQRIYGYSGVGALVRNETHCDAGYTPKLRRGSGVTV